MTLGPTTLLQRLDALDRQASAAIVVKPRADGRPRHWVRVLRRFSEAGSYGVGWIVLFGVVGIANDGLVRGIVAATLIVATLVLNTGIKNVFKRPRPSARAIDHAPSSYSMPSAHTSMAMVGAATMGVIVPGQWALWWAVAVALGLSRVMLGMHYLADVLLGAALGLVLGLLVAAPIIQSI